MTAVHPLRYAIVFGESVLNDAVAIVLVSIVQALGDQPGGFTQPSHYAIGIGQFLLVCLGSLAIAAAVSAASALHLRVLRRDLRHHASFEVALIFLFGYVCYVAADAAGCSGILSLFVAGVLESHYHVYSLSESGRHATAIALKSLAHTFEAAIFAYIGLDLFASLDPAAAAAPAADAAGGDERAAARPPPPTRRRCRCPFARASRVLDPPLAARPRC